MTEENVNGNSTESPISDELIDYLTKKEEELAYLGIQIIAGYAVREYCDDNMLDYETEEMNKLYLAVYNKVIADENIKKQIDEHLENPIPKQYTEEIEEEQNDFAQDVWNIVNSLDFDDMLSKIE